MESCVNEKLYRSKDMCKMFNVVPNTLRTWEAQGKIKCIRTAGGHRRYILEEDKAIEQPKRNILYCRVSSSGQKGDLERQIKYLRSRFPDFEVIKDVGSGINFKRKGLKTILGLAKEGVVGKVVVTYRDRLCRFGFEFFEWAIKEWSNGEIVVLNQKETSPQEELVNDLLSIITVFSSRLYGLRSHSVKRKIKEAANEKENSKGFQNNEIPIISN